MPGLQAFVADSVKNYSAATVKTMLQDTAVVISQFQTAAAATEAQTAVTAASMAADKWRQVGPILKC